MSRDKEEQKRPDYENVDDSGVTTVVLKGTVDPVSREKGEQKRHDYQNVDDSGVATL